MGFSDRFDAKPRPWMLYGVMNEAPVNEKIDAMHSFASDFFSEFK